MEPQSSSQASSNEMSISSSSHSAPLVRSALHESFQQQQQQQSCLRPCSPDMNARRSISDSVLARHRQQPQKYGNQNTVYMMISRSGGPAVKKMIAAIEMACLAQEQGNPASVVVPPELECCILAQWAVDSFYRVVIAGNGGIPAIVRTMKAFPYHRALQECCCLALSNLCMLGGNLVAIENAGCVPQIILAMKNHPTSVAVQSAACEALRNMCGLLIVQPQAVVGDLVEVLSNAKHMCLHPKHSSTVMDLLTIFSVVPIGTRAVSL